MCGRGYDMQQKAQRGWEVSTEFDQDCSKTTWFIPIFLLSPSHCKFFLTNGGHVFPPILLICNRNLDLSPQRLYIKFGVDTVKIQKSLFILLFFRLCKLAKKSIMVASTAQVTFLESTFSYRCVLNLKSIGLTGCGGWPFKVFTFLVVNYSATIRSIGPYFLWSIITSSPVMVPSFMSLARSSSQQIDQQHKKAHNDQ